jgi:FixJ family two-component response regulator
MTNKHNIVYVIDDDAPVRKAFARLLRSADFEAETFSSPDDFLSMTRTVQDACIIADIRMPGSTGFDLTERLAASDIRIPVIIVSASDDAQTLEYARQLGAVAFFRKPVDDQALLDAVSWALSGSQRSIRNDSK